MADRLCGESAEPDRIEGDAGGTAPTVSVVIPVYNGADTLQRALESVFAQTFRDYEVVIVDDGSTDDLAGTLKPFGHRDIRVLRHDVNQGAAAARNTGVAAARGRLIAFLDSDDEWLPTKLAQQVAYLDSAPAGTRLCCSGFAIITRDGAKPRHHCPAYRPDEPALDRLVFGCDLSPGSTMLVDRRSFEETGPFNTSLRRLEDWDWLMRFAAHHRIGVVNESLAYIYSLGHPDSKQVYSAIETLEHLYLNEKPFSNKQHRYRFRSSIVLEKAASHYRDGRILRTFSLVLRSILVYPWRDRLFYRRMLQKLYQACLPRPGAIVAGKVLHVITDLNVGGAERSLANLVRADPAGRWPPPTVVSLKAGGRFVEELRAAGIDVQELGVRRPADALRAIGQLAALIRRERPEVIQSWMYHADLAALLGLMLSRRRRATRLFWGVRCSDMNLTHYHRNLRLVVRLCTRLSHLPDGVVANSEAGRTVHRQLGYRPKRFEIVDNGIDPERFRLPPGTRADTRVELGLPADATVITAVARLDPMKGYDHFIAALGALPDVHGLAVGHGTENLPDAPRLHRLGRRADVARLLAASDILVSSSLFGEGFSNAIVEAMAAGLPVVATDVGDSRRIVGDAGIIIAPDNNAALSAALRSLIDDPAARRRLGERAHARVVDAFSLSRMVQGFARVHAADPFRADR